MTQQPRGRNPLKLFAVFRLWRPSSGSGWQRHRGSHPPIHLRSLYRSSARTWRLWWGCCCSSALCRGRASSCSAMSMNIKKISMLFYILKIIFGLCFTIPFLYIQKLNNIVIEKSILNTFVSSFSSFTSICNIFSICALPHVYGFVRLVSYE